MKPGNWNPKTLNPKTLYKPQKPEILRPKVKIAAYSQCFCSSSGDVLFGYGRTYGLGRNTFVEVNTPKLAHSVLLCSGIFTGLPVSSLDTYPYPQEILRISGVRDCKWSSRPSSNSRMPIVWLVPHLAPARPQNGVSLNRPR